MFLHSKKAQNRVSHIGGLVIKRFLGSNAQRRYCSEKLMRAFMRERGIAVVPTIIEADIIRTIVMPDMGTSTMLAVASIENIRKLAEHVVKLADKLKAPAEQVGYFWLGDTSKAPAFATFADFLTTQLEKYLTRHGSGFLNHKQNEVGNIFQQTSIGGDPVYCLNDLAPKNVFFLNSTFVHFDFESSLSAPRDFFLSKCAVNLVRDLGPSHGALSSAHWIISQCEDQKLVFASLAFAIVRMQLYRWVFRGRGIDGQHALRSICGASSAESVLEEIAYATN
jgi:hypothetical protein